MGDIFCDENDKPIALVATCSCCGYTDIYELNDEENKAIDEYFSTANRKPIQDLFPKVPAWIRSGAIDKFSGGFCICPNCCE